MVVFTPEPCEHEETIKSYSFADYKYMEYGYSSVVTYCKKCDKKVARHSQFQGELVDKSYLSALIDNSDANEIVNGEYYTVTAIVTLAEYDSYGAPSISCKVENEDFIVDFSVEFREEFRESVRYDSLEEGTKITFRGRLYDKGVGFTDAELIIE